MIRKIQSEIELASVETKLRDLYKELASKENIKQEIVKCKKEVKRFTGNVDVERVDNNHIHSRERSFTHASKEHQSPPQRDEEQEMLVPFPDKSSVNDVLNNKPNSSQVRQQPKRRIPRPYIGKWWDK